MLEAVRRTLAQRGFKVNDEAYRIIGECDDWYRARETEQHRRVTVGGAHYELVRMGFGRRIAMDEANLCEVLEVNPGAEAFDLVQRVLRENRFDSQYRKQLELVAAEGTAACYVRMEGAEEYDDGSLAGGRIRLSYVEAGGFAPLTVENDEVVEAAFWGTDCIGTKEVTTLVVCTRDEDGIYSYSVRAFDADGNEIAEREQDVVLGDVKPFSVLRTADVNTFDGMAGFGYPKLHGVIPVLAGLDAAYTALMGDIDTAEKITLINEQLCKFDGLGDPITPNEQMKRRFVMLGEKLPEQNELVHEITPVVRVEQFRDVIELLMGMLTRQFGFGSRKYSMDAGGELVTATQYIGERHDMMQELNRQRFEAREYITGIVRAVLWFANRYLGADMALDAAVEIEFDDSYITNRSEQMDEMRKDVLDGIGGKYVRRAYLKQRYNLTDEEAEIWAAQTKEVEE